MTNRERIRILDAAIAELKQTTRGFTPVGTHWRKAFRELAELRASLAPKPGPPAPPPKPPIPPYTGLFRQDGLMLVTPDGNAETKAREAVARGYGWIAGNVGDGHSWPDWKTAGTFLPWARTYTPADVIRLLDQAAASRSPAALVNLEVEAKNTLPPDLVDELVTSHLYGGEVGISMEGWLYNAVDWTPLAGYVFLLQTFGAYATKINDCIQHAHDLGIRTAFPTLEAYGAHDGHPDRAGWAGPISIFPGDNVDVWP